MRRVPVVVPLLLLGSIAGCGGEGSQASTGRERPTPPSVPAEPSQANRTELTIVVTGVADGPRSWTLRCDPPGGDHPDPDAACAALEAARSEAGDPFAPVPKDQLCTQVYGGPQTARVRGWWGGASVDATFNRVNGCEVARWDRLAALLGRRPRGDA